MRDILRPDYDQVLLLPPVMEDWIGAEHPARFIREVVAQSGSGTPGISQPDPHTGGTCYAPEMLLAVWLYGYCRGIRSTRKLEAACREDMGFVWLSGNLRPDHNALWRFWNANHEALRGFFKDTVRLAMRMDLVGFALEAIDGTKIPALCAARRGYDEAGLERALSRAEQRVMELEQALRDAAADISTPESALPAELRSATRLREKVQAALESVRAGERRHCHPQEPEAARMVLSTGGNRFGYNGQACVDAKAQLITACELSTQASDNGLLMGLKQAAEQNTESKTAQTLADSGYQSGATFSAAEAAGADVIVPLPESVQGRDDQPWHNSCFHYDEARDVVLCPEGHILRFHHQRQRREMPVRVFRNSAACRHCPVRKHCTKDKAGRAIDITPHHTALVRHREKMKRPEVRKLYGRRSGIVEPVFARAKAQSGFMRFTVRGKAKAAVQWALVCTAVNLRRLHSFWKTRRSEAVA